MPRRERDAGNGKEDPGGDPVAEPAEQKAGRDRPEHLGQEDGGGLDPVQALGRQDRELVEDEPRADARAQGRDRGDGPEGLVVRSASCDV